MIVLPSAVQQEIKRTLHCVACALDQKETCLSWEELENIMLLLVLQYIIICIHYSEGSLRSGLPIDKLKVHGNQLSQQHTQTQKPVTAAAAMGSAGMSPPGSPHPPTNSATVLLQQQANSDSSATQTGAAATPSNQPSTSSYSMVRDLNPLPPLTQLQILTHGIHCKQSQQIRRCTVVSQTVCHLQIQM